MPGFDRTGPMGQGARTGWGMGRCNPDNDMEKNENNMRPMDPAFGRGRGGGFGRGFGRGLGRGMGRGLGRGFGRGFRRDWDDAPYNQNDKESK